MAKIIENKLVSCVCLSEFRLFTGVVYSVIETAFQDHSLCLCSEVSDDDEAQGKPSINQEPTFGI